MFNIHSQLLNDCHYINLCNNCHVLLHKNASLHWFILVPETSSKNLLELDESSLNEVMKTSQFINQYLMNDLAYKKTNVASIGNLVDQCHVHVVGRRLDDACWPQPVWGNLPEGPQYSSLQIDQIKKDLV